jgi:FkbM family methyltransferase
MGENMGILLQLFERVPPSWIRAAGAVRGSSPRVKAMTDWLPRLLRGSEGRIQRGLGKGLRFNGANSAVGFVLGTHDPEVQYALSRLLEPGMVTYDIGANVGFTAMLAARKVGPGGRVVCFEPLAEPARQIEHNARINGFPFVEVHQVALARSDGEAEFFVSKESTWGRLSQAGPAPMQSGVIKVPMRTLDSFAREKNLPRPDFIKMDVEGVEADLIAGGHQFLSESRPIMVIELHHTFAAVKPLLDALDYEVRPLTADGRLVSTDGEFQILAYPREKAGAEKVCAELAAHKTVFE